MIITVEYTHRHGTDVIPAFDEIAAYVIGAELILSNYEEIDEPEQQMEVLRLIRDARYREAVAAFNELNSTGESITLREHPQIAVRIAFDPDQERTLAEIIRAVQEGMEE